MQKKTDNIDTVFICHIFMVNRIWWVSLKSGCFISFIPLRFVSMVFAGSLEMIILSDVVKNGSVITLLLLCITTFIDFCEKKILMYCYCLMDDLDFQSINKYLMTWWNDKCRKCADLSKDWRNIGIVWIYWMSWNFLNSIMLTSYTPHLEMVEVNIIY